MSKLITPDFQRAKDLSEYENHPYFSYFCQVIDYEFLGSHFSDPVEFLNDLFSEFEIIKANKSLFYDDLGKHIMLQTELIANRLGGTYRYLLLLLIQSEINSYDDKYTFDDPELDNDPGNKVAWVKDKEIEKVFYGLAYKWRRHLIKLPKQGYYLFSRAKSNINKYITFDFFDCIPLREIEFNVEVYNSISHYEKETHLKFFYLLYEYIEILNRWYDDPLLIINSIKEDPQGENADDNYLQCNKLLYWLLIALKNRIGFKKVRFGDTENSFKLLYKLLNNEAKMLNCSPENDPDAPDFPLVEIDENLNKLEGSPGGASKFKLTEKLSKADLIRILNTLVEGGYIDCPKNSKKEFMVQAGKLFNVDLSDYANNLRPATNSDFEYEAIFKELGSSCKTIFENILEEKRKKK